MRRVPCLAILLAAVLYTPLAGAEDSNSPPAQFTAQQDHQRIMDLLHMTSFRRRKDDANYDEAKANPYPNIPEPLTMNDGRKVTIRAEVVAIDHSGILKIIAAQTD